LNELARRPIGFVNLLCATCLSDTTSLDIRACLTTLEEWTQFVAGETNRQMHRFRRNPAEYNNSEGYYRVLVMITALQRDIGITYNPDAVGDYNFKNSGDSFIHGLLTGKKQGTCASMPVLYAAVGRRLGYPIYLCLANGHVFCRWHNFQTRERFNIEATGRGLNTFPDDHYLKWPRPIKPVDVRSGLFLRNLNPDEELALFMATRAHCLLDREHLMDAIVAYSHAHRLAPTDPHYMDWLMRAINAEIDARATGKLPGTFRSAEEDPFNHPSALPIKRFVLPDRSTRCGGVHLAGTQAGRMAPNN
jgi:hypothetical protein